jgi:hypothetical protein
VSTAFHVLAVLTVIFLVLGIWLCKLADRPGDDFGAVFPGLLSLAVAALCFLAWLVLAIVRAW